MNKKISIILLLCVSLFAACGNKGGENTSTTTDSTAIKGDSVASDVPAVNDSAKSSPGEVLMRTEGVGEVVWGMNLNELADVLGEPERVEDSKDMAYTWQFYTKQGLEVCAETSEERMASVVSIVATKPCSLKTKRGIGIGSTAEEVREKYKDVVNAAESNDGLIVAGDIYAGLTFAIEKGKVTRIFIGQDAE